MTDKFVVTVYASAKCEDCLGTGWLSMDDYQGVLPGIREGCSSVVCECSSVDLIETVEAEKQDG